TISGNSNPALPPFQTQPFVMGAVGILTLDRSLNILCFTQALKPSAGLSFVVINSGVSGIDGRDRDGRPTELLSTSENLFQLSFGLRLNDWISIGVSPKIFYYSLYHDVSSTTVGVDAGAIAIVTPNLTVGIAVQDIGSKYRWDTSRLYGLRGNITEDRFPQRVRLGAAYHIGAPRILIAGEVEIVGTSNLLRTGIEYAPVEKFQVRAGIDQIGFGKDDMAPKPSFGFTLTWPVGNWQPGVSYAYSIEPYSPGGIHIFSLLTYIP
ncbi:MAG: hypothetical protein WD295_01000, partial [Bacteroidota bacterium]